jgi:hypothetical protein
MSETAKKARAEQAPGPFAISEAERGALRDVEQAALEVAGIIAAAAPWSAHADGGWHRTRASTIALFYEGFARARLMRCRRMDEVIPELATVWPAASEVVRRLPLAELTPEHFGHVHETLVGCGLADRQVVPTDGRRTSGAHFTPRELADKVMRTTLDPAVKLVREDETATTPFPRRLLGLRICDPAVGAGAFLLAAVRYLGELLHAHAREDPQIQVHHLRWAKQAAASYCAHGVDKDPCAVLATRCALALETGNDGAPLSGLPWDNDYQRNICHGDALVGLSFDQVRRFHWGAGGEPCAAALACVARVVERRRVPLHAALADLPGHIEAYELAKADVELVSDVCLGAFFSQPAARAREAERLRRRDLVERWHAARGSAEGEALEAELREMQRQLRAEQAPFSWDLAFLDKTCEERGARSWAHAFIGNPPFMGGGKVSRAFGNEYLDWLMTLHEGASGRTDLSAHFFRRAHALLGENGGFLGFIATNSIGQGDTRLAGLQYLVDHGMTIYNATTSMTWPGPAKVTVSIVHLAQ